MKQVKPLVSAKLFMCYVVNLFSQSTDSDIRTGTATLGGAG